MTQFEHQSEPTTKTTDRPARRVNWGVIFLTLVLVGFIGFQLYARRTAPVPELFDRSATLQTGLEDSRETGKPVFALLTADWCGACQVFKRNALAEPETTEFLLERTVPIYVDFDKDPEDTLELARRANLGPNIALPTSILLVDGRVVGTRKGVLSSADLRTWINETTAD